MALAGDAETVSERTCDFYRQRSPTHFLTPGPRPRSILPLLSPSALLFSHPHRTQAHAVLQRAFQESQAQTAALEQELAQAAEECQQMQSELRDTHVRPPLFFRQPKMWP